MNHTRFADCVTISILHLPQRTETGGPNYCIRTTLCGPCVAATAGSFKKSHTVKILKIGTPEIITIIVLQLEQLDFIVQYCVQKMQTE